MAWTTPPSSGQQITSATIADIITKQQTWGGNVSAAGYDLNDLGTIEQDAWTAITPQNSWANIGIGYAPLECRKDKQGRVWIRGALSGGTATNGTVVGTLPVGMRPTLAQYIACVAIQTSGTTNPSILVLSSGDLSITGLLNNTLLAINGSIALD